MNARDRGTLLHRLADLMDEHKEELATIESIDSGAVYTLALKTHVGMSIDTWRYFAGWCDKIEGSTIPINNARPNRNLTITRREPVGVCGLITPWNYPLMMLSWKMAACLAAGNTVVIKPAQVSPLTALKFAELSHMAGIPDGVINVLPGSGSVTGQAIADHPKVRKLGFTGSTEIGHTIMESCAKSNLKKVSLELGGKSPLIVFGDCDLDKAVKGAMSGVFFNKGENCIAAGRIFVEETIYDEFLERVVAATKTMVIGDPLDRGTQHGPQNHRAHLEKLVQYCETGVKEGARLLLGGKQCDMPGLYMEPTIFADVEDGTFISIEESFGPIMVCTYSFLRFISLCRCITCVSSLTYVFFLRSSQNSPRTTLTASSRGQTTPNSASPPAYSQMMCPRSSNPGLVQGHRQPNRQIALFSQALYVSERIEAGTCFVNTYNKTDVAAPFGGFKMSGFGKDLGKEALNEYLKTKTITFEFN